MRLFLVRHGETNWTAERKLQGQADIPLSAEGRRQAASLARLVQTFDIEIAVSSDLSRARETAEILGFMYPQLQPGWREADLGQWTGCHEAELKVLHGQDYRAWRDGRFTPPGGESWQGLCARVKSALAVTTSADKNILIVTHGGPIRAACSILLELHPWKIIPVSPASVTVIVANDRPRLYAFNIAPDIEDSWRSTGNSPGR